MFTVFGSEYTRCVVKSSLDLEPGRTGSEAVLCHLLALWLWAHNWSSGFLSCKMDLIVPIAEVVL